MRQTNILTYLAAAAIVTILVALVYTTVQQAHRSGANDPQLQIASDISKRLGKGATTDKWFSGDTIEISQSLSVFNVLYNDKGDPVMSTGVLNGKMPSLPQGVFAHSAVYGENVFTWQPQKGVRIAMVLRSVHSPAWSYVAVGRSLLEVEKREEYLRWMVFISWLLCMGVIMLHWLITFFKKRKHANG
jgi:hypothetical protein